MKISTKLKLSSILIIATILIFFSVVFYGFTRTERNVERSRISEEILKNSLLAKVLQYDYIQTGAERPKAQWYALQNSLNETLDQGKSFFTELNAKEIFTTIYVNQEKRKNIFDALVMAREQEDNPDLIINLDNQLAVMAQERTEQATRLAELGREEDTTIRQTLSFLILALGFLTIITSLFSYFIGRRISRSLRALGQEFTRVSELDFSSSFTTTTTTTTGKDEIGLLARAFSVMVNKLKGSYSGLDKKVEEQTKDLKKKTKDLADQKTAILNILEDVEKEKNKFEQVTNKLTLATKSAQIGVWEWDVVKNIITWDDQMYKIYGLKKEEFGGAYEAWQAGLHPDDKKPGDEAIKMALSGEKEFSPIFRVVWPNGEIRYVQAYALVERDDLGKPIKMIGVNFDITHEREVDRAKTEFVSLASHQLRTPLSAINWYTEMLLAGDAGAINDEQRKYLNEVAIGNQRMVALVDSLLNVSRLDLGTFIIEPESLDLIEMSKSIIEELKPQIIGKKLKIDELYSENSIKFQADKKLLRMVFQNLLSNAVKYTKDEGLVKIEIGIIVGNSIFGDKKIEKDSLGIKVSDSGIGVPDDQKDKIFLKMFRADNARESETEGTGLGLYIIKSIIDKSGGEIWFESVLNKGSTFYVIFPLSGMKKREGSRKLD